MRDHAGCISYELETMKISFPPFHAFKLEEKKIRPAFDFIQLLPLFLPFLLFPSIFKTFKNLTARFLRRHKVNLILTMFKASQNQSTLPSLSSYSLPKDTHAGRFLIHRAASRNSIQIQMMLSNCFQSYTQGNDGVLGLIDSELLTLIVAFQ